MAITDLHSEPDPNKPGKTRLLPKDARRGKRWQADWTTSTGKRERARFDIKADAEAYQAEQLRLKSRGVTVDSRAAQKTLVSDLWKLFRVRLVTVGAAGRSPASARTLQKYDRVYRGYIEPRWGASPVAAVRYADVSEWIVNLEAVSGGAATVSTRHEVSGIFQTLMKHAVREDLLSTNPAYNAAGESDYKPRATTAKDHVYLTMPQLLALAARTPGYESLILTAGLCGLRWGEITALQVQDVTLGKRPELIVRRAYEDLAGKLSLKTTKNGKDRRVPLPHLIADIIAPLVTDRPADAHVWNSPRGAVLRHSGFTKRNLANAVAAAAADAAKTKETFPELTFHDLRHTAVSLAITEGANVKVVQRIAGHHSAALTLDTYAGLFDDDLHDSAARLNAGLGRHLENYRHLFVT
ncbi:site-specific integrase [Paeniglutamicibacter sulfureus]|uniref:tyrosine-type recombinase/integrase n=1 Tax=Paeniglutamicibacter sulfureus TaxID=43666 RepID=UPI002665C17E|nr:site-specific integrase [Paeniglutamicibacter sulfureus]MDO2933454.1 site-specific integrase [Paeniglutamicibacter sulfureus]